MKNKRYSKDELSYIADNYKTKSHQEIANAIGRTRPSVRNICYRNGFVSTNSEWTQAQVDLLINAYRRATVGSEIELDKLSTILGKHKSNVCRKAKSLGLTDRKRQMVADHKKFKVKNKYKSRDEAFEATATAVRKRWASTTKEQDMERVKKMLKTKVKNGTYAIPRHKTTWKQGWRNIGGNRKYYRSRWEANYARYLEFLKTNGNILDWKHEPKTFWFDGIKRGVVSYLPDFWVQTTAISEEYHEVKGWMDAKSKTKIKRMAKYHPQVKLIVIREKQYNEIKRKLGGAIMGWE